MKLLRVLYLLVLVISLGTAIIFYFQTQWKDEQLTQQFDLNQLSTEVLAKMSRQLAQKVGELEEALQKVEQLDQAIASLEKEKAGFTQKLQALQKERESLLARVSLLLEERSDWEERFTALEQKFSSLQEKFYSVVELKKAIRLALMERRQKRRRAKIEMLRRQDEIALQQGNRGYLVKAGKSTYRPTRIRVELEPINKWSYREIEGE